MTVRKVGQLTTPTTVRNSSVENLLFQLPAPAYALENAGAVRLTAAGTILNTSASTGRVTLKIKLSTSTGTTGTIIGETTTLLMTTSNNPRHWQASAHILEPSTGDQYNWTNITVTSPTTRTAGLSTASYSGWSTAALNEAAPIYVKMTGEMSTASTNFTLIGGAAWIEVVK